MYLLFENHNFWIPRADGQIYRGPYLLYHQADVEKNENSHSIGNYFFSKCMLKEKA